MGKLSSEYNIEGSSVNHKSVSNRLSVKSPLDLASQLNQTPGNSSLISPAYAGYGNRLNFSGTSSIDSDRSFGDAKPGKEDSLADIVEEQDIEMTYLNKKLAKVSIKASNSSRSTKLSSKSNKSSDSGLGKRPMSALVFNDQQVTADPVPVRKTYTRRPSKTQNVEPSQDSSKSKPSASNLTGKVSSGESSRYTKIRSSGLPSASTSKMTSYKSRSSDDKSERLYAKSSRDIHDTPDDDVFIKADEVANVNKISGISKKSVGSRPASPDDDLSVKAEVATVDKKSRISNKASSSIPVASGAAGVKTTLKSTASKSSAKSSEKSSAKNSEKPSAKSSGTVPRSTRSTRAGARGAS